MPAAQVCPCSAMQIQGGNHTVVSKIMHIYMPNYFFYFSRRLKINHINPERKINLFLRMVLAQTWTYSYSHALYMFKSMFLIRTKTTIWFAVFKTESWSNFQSKLYIFEKYRGRGWFWDHYIDPCTKIYKFLNNWLAIVGKLLYCLIIIIAQKWQLDW